MAAKKDWTRLRDLFDRTANLDAAERARLLDQECGDDHDLRRQVEEMLAAHDAAGGFLTAPTEPQVADHTLTREATDPAPGTIIGPYKLLQQIGEGGFGVVYMAEQQKPIVRRVALKVIKLGMDTKQVIARFEAERQALALMDHPSIARILDAGATEAGRPYFVMELVHGIPITEYCDREVLTTRQRLELFIPVCQAVAHAHQKGVIHRDLKPNNVLVTLHDGVPVPKVIDFGIARAIHQRLTERTLFTEYGQLIGTPEYMSPEQAEMSGLDIDTRSDIYSLGALLYELLTGEKLFDPKLLRSLALQEIQRVLREEEPARPSARISRLGVTATEVAHHRGVEANQLVRLLRGDPDWIVVKAIAKDRRRRYDSAGALAEDIERALRSEPVFAGPPSRLYRLRKFARRHRGSVAAALAVMAAVLTFGSLALWQGKRAVTEGLKARINMILAAAASAKDPVVKALLVRELDGLPGLGAGELSKAQSVLGAPLPVTVLGEAHPGDGGPDRVAVSPDGTRIVIASWDGTVRVLRSDGTGEPVLLGAHARAASAPGAGSHSVPWVGFSPDGDRVATCGWDRTVRVWPIEGGEPVVLRGHEDQVHWAAWSPDGARLVTASVDGTVRIWPTNGAGRAIVLKDPRVLKTSFSSDGAAVVTASVDGTARVWRANGSGAPTILDGHEGRVRSAIFSPNGRSVLTASDDGTARVWRADGIGTPIILRGHEGRVASANFSPDGGRVVTASSDRTARVWRADGRGEPVVLEGHQDALRWAGFSTDGSSILTASEDGTVRAWEPFVRPSEPVIISQSVPAEAYRGRKARFRAKVRVEAAEGSVVAQLWLRVDGKTGLGFFDNMRDRPITSSHWREYEIVGEVLEDALTITVGMMLHGSGRAWMDAATLEIMDGQVPVGQGLVDGGFEAKPRRGWSLVGLEEEENPAEGRYCIRLEGVSDRRVSYRSRVLANHGRAIRVISSGAMGGQNLLTSSDDGVVRVWRTGGPGEPVILMGHGGGIKGFSTGVSSAAFSGDGQHVVTASSDGTVRVWRTDGTGEPVVLRGHESLVIRAAFSPDDQFIVSASYDGTARVWRADGTGEPLVLRGHGRGLNSAAFSPDGRSVVTASEDSTGRLWRCDGTGGPVLLRAHRGAVLWAAFSPDGRRIVTGSKDSTARVWRADGTRDPVVLRGHHGWVTSAVFSPDGQRIVTASRDGSARVWHPDGAGTPVVLECGEGAVYTAKFSPDSRRVVTALAEDATARVWRADGTGAPVLLKGHEGGVTTASFSPDGQRVLTATRNGTARVWRADGIGEPVVLKGHEWEVTSAAFSRDGQRIVTSSLDGTARVWRVTWKGLFEYLSSNVALCLRPEERMQYLGESRSEAVQRYADCESRRGRSTSSPDAK